ncbi:hypothetical protein CPB83DRAFT_857656 [Crepidotus variabilis]|uniref:Transmembrane protein n=1 Tax=Crepidotus variabilis TaxID=179855 RepID=A0A9P6ECH0_9AGAR|nr:hypothetical protein CPB83DRAFT_857656 [Crepidotus variabilis]
MPLFTTLVEDTSPLLQYSPEWSAGHSENDPLADKYTQSTFTLTNVKGASVSFQFYGSSVSIFGAVRSNHGKYHVQLDNTTFPSVSGAATTERFNYTLFSSKLDQGLHNVTLMNDENAFLDVDYVVFDTTIGQSSEPLVINTFSSAHPSFVYSPSSAWGSPALPGTFLGGYGRGSSDPSGVANFTFSGSAVAIYGPVGPNNTRSFSAQIDGMPVNTFSAHDEFYHPQQMLFQAGNLQSGSHSLLIRPQQSGGGSLEIDFASVYSTPSLGGSYGSAAVAQPPGAQVSQFLVSGEASHSTRGLVAGVAFTTVVAAVALVAFVFLFLRHRRVVRRLSAVTPSKEEHNKDIDYVPSYVEPYTLTSSSVPYRASSLGHGLASRSELNHHDPFASASLEAVSVSAWSDSYYQTTSPSVYGTPDQIRALPLIPQRPSSLVQKDKKPTPESSTSPKTNDSDVPPLPEYSGTSRLAT